MALPTPKPGQRYTIFTANVSTLVRPNSRDEEESLGNMLQDFERHIERPDIASRVLGVRYDPANAVAVPRKTPAEKGGDPRGGRMHIHFSVETLHYDEVTLPEVGRRMQEELVHFARMRGIELPGAYVNLKLSRDSYRANYEIKGIHGPAVSFNPAKATKYKELFGRRGGKK